MNLYIASCTTNGGIYIISEDGIKEKYGCDRPMYLCIKDNRLYSVLREVFDDGSSGIISYEIGDEGKLINATEPITTNGIVGCHLCESAGNVYCANYLSGNVSRNSDITVTHVGCGVNKIRQDMAHPHFVCESPDKKYLFVTDLGLDKIFVYDKNLKEISNVDIPSGHGARHIAFHEDNTTVFCVNELKSTVSVLKYNDSHLVLKDTFTALPDSFDGVSTAAAIRCVGNMVYVSNRGHDSVSVMHYDKGTLNLIENISVYGKGPRDIWVYNDIVVCTNENSNNVTFVSLETGKLIKEIKIESPIAVIQYMR